MALKKWLSTDLWSAFMDNYNTNIDELNVTMEGYDKFGGPKGVYATVAALTSAHPTGDANIYVVTADGKWYYWNGSAWTAGGVYQSTGISAASVSEAAIVNNAVSPAKTDFLTPVKNLIKTIIQGETVNTLGVTAVNASFQRTDYIFLRAGTYIYSNATAAYASLRICIYNTDKVFVSTQTTAAVTMSIDGYVIIADAATRTNLQLEAGATASTYQAYLVELSNFKPRVSADIANNAITTQHVVRGAIKPTFTNFLTVGKNKINFATNTQGKFINYATGAITDDTSYQLTDYVYLAAGDYVYTNSLGVYSQLRMAFFDDNFNFISGLTQTAAQAFTITSGHWTRLCDAYSVTHMQLELGTIATRFENYNLTIPTITNQIINKRLIFNGDSITYGTGFSAAERATAIFPALVAAHYRTSFLNYGIGGSTLAVKESDPTTKDPLITRYASMSDDGDVIIIAIGSNDWNYAWTPVGSMADRTNYTFYGALHNLCVGLLDKYIGKTIIFMTPLKRKATTDVNDTDALVTNSLDLTLRDYADMIKEVCGYYGIPVLDNWRESCLTPFIAAQRAAYYMETNGTGVHPTLAGHEIMARRIIAFVNSIIGY